MASLGGKLHKITYRTPFIIWLLIYSVDVKFFAIIMFSAKVHNYSTI